MDYIRFVLIWHLAFDARNKLMWLASIEMNLYAHFLFIHRMAEVGKLVIPKLNEKYATGQFFLHRVFGYRGVILFPWRAKIYDRNTYAAGYGDSANESSLASKTEISSTKGTATNDEEGTTTNSNSVESQSEQVTRKIDSVEVDTTRNDGRKEVSVDVQTYYQVLIDSRDCPHVVICNFSFISFTSDEFTS